MHRLTRHVIGSFLVIGLVPVLGFTPDRLRRPPSLSSTTTSRRRSWTLTIGSARRSPTPAPSSRSCVRRRKLHVRIRFTGNDSGDTLARAVNRPFLANPDRSSASRPP